MRLLFPEGRSRTLTFSYDDGVEQDARLIAAMQARGLKGTFNLNSGLWAELGHVYAPGTIHRRMTLADAQRLYTGSGMEIAAHALTHASLTSLTEPEVLTETLEDRKGLERQFGGVVRGMAYPYGTYSARVADLLGACGIAYCRTVNSTHRFDLPENWLTLHPTCHHDDPKLFDLVDAFLTDNGGDRPRLFYIWGHAYEFEQNGNFDRFERLADRLQGHADVWYATNIELYDYASAFQRLIRSMDGRVLINPSARALWIRENGKTVMIPGGAETAL